ncbi:MAG: radical SAM protein [Coriobacteriia bacterium]|nr:radical SAM protein [Coriobacteriia bacterium]
MKINESKEHERRQDLEELDEQALAEAMAPCGSEAIGISLNHRQEHLNKAQGHPHAQNHGGHPAGLQRHGGSRSQGFRPGGGPAALAYEERTGIKAPRIIAWELTRSCNLSCAHCRAASEFGFYPGELSTDEIKATIDTITTITNPILILTGGEPLLRPDIWEIIDYSKEKGASPVVATNGTLLSEEVAKNLAAHKVPRISVSIDFPTAELHDEFRGKQGAFEETIEGIKRAKAHGVGVQINTTVTKLNYHLLEELHDLALSLKVDAFHIFLLVPTGRGEDLVEVELTPDEYETALTWAYERQKTSPMHFKPTDAPQYYRIIHQKALEEGSSVSAEQYGLDAITRGCLGGITFCFISHTGDIQPCGYFNLQCGNVKEIPYDEIWTNSPVLNDLRDYSKLEGKCGACEYRGVCGGCRARALAISGNYMQEEPYCAYTPRKWREEGKKAHARKISL